MSSAGLSAVYENACDCFMICKSKNNAVLCSHNEASQCSAMSREVYLLNAELRTNSKLHGTKEKPQKAVVFIKDQNCKQKNYITSI